MLQKSCSGNCVGVKNELFSLFTFEPHGDFWRSTTDVFGIDDMSQKESGILSLSSKFGSSSVELKRNIYLYYKAYGYY